MIHVSFKQQSFVKSVILFTYNICIVQFHIFTPPFFNSYSVSSFGRSFH